MRGFRLLVGALIVSLVFGSGMPGVAQTVAELPVAKPPETVASLAPDLPKADATTDSDALQAAPQNSPSTAPLPRRHAKHKGLIAAAIVGGLLLFVVLAAVSLGHS